MDNVTATQATAPTDSYRPASRSPQPTEPQPRPQRTETAEISETAKASLAAEESRSTNAQIATQSQQAAAVAQRPTDPSSRLYA
jgi:hypothetical protein